jgi:hypothetical protein
LTGDRQHLPLFHCYQEPLGAARVTAFLIDLRMSL